ncbi:hypothetical protein TRFO_38679 [Tritrichomonas foetus]|uniref:Uncharacterized protein n=1 Tax=Tritrichomonas foetus TaxID=1144522 RepID=A0A1J4J8T7_9EUKA|nr:hypothetical protein TRFO_38679 [Tritrichomonas foetus]|eukprot:OHS95105.1 hypothetical protein TRFO_38679 [Tritrichomonas foetus]
MIFLFSLFFSSFCQTTLFNYTDFGLNHVRLNPGSELELSFLLNDFVTVFIFDSDQSNQIYLNNATSLVRSHFVTSDKKIILSSFQNSTKTFQLNFWIIPRHFCMLGVSTVLFNQHARLRLNTRHAESPRCVFPITDYSSYNFSTLINDTNTINYIITNTSLQNNQTYISTINGSLENIHINEPFFFSFGIDSKFVENISFHFDTTMYSIYLPKKCFFEETPRFINSKYNATDSSNLIHMCNCDFKEGNRFDLLLPITLLLLCLIVMIIGLFGFCIFKYTNNKNKMQYIKNDKSNNSSKDHFVTTSLMTTDALIESDNESDGYVNSKDYRLTKSVSATIPKVYSTDEDDNVIFFSRKGTESTSNEQTTSD